MTEAQARERASRVVDAIGFNPKHASYGSLVDLVANELVKPEPEQAKQPRRWVVEEHDGSKSIAIDYGHISFYNGGQERLRLNVDVSHELPQIDEELLDRLYSAFAETTRQTRYGEAGRAGIRAVLRELGLLPKEGA